MARYENLSNNEKCQMLTHIRYEIESFFLSPLVESHRLLIENEQLRESLRMRQVVHCRALLDFFYKKIQDLREDDLSAKYHYDYACVCGIDKADQVRFNKDIFHITADRLRRTSQDKEWPISVVFPIIKRECCNFIDYLIKSGMGDINCSDAEKDEWVSLKSKISHGDRLVFSTGNTAPTVL